MLREPRLRLSATLWLAAMSGVAVLSLTVLPQLLERSQQSVPLGVAVAASAAQSGILVALAVWAGVALSPRLGLGAPVIEAALSGADVWPLLRGQLAPAAIVGTAVGGVLVLLTRMAPAELLALGQALDIPVAAKVLYGGVTEEVLMRWGLMTALVWLPWRFIQKRAGLPRRSYVIGAIVVVALLFGALHLPAALAMGASLTPPVVGYILAGNAVPGALFGFLYWRYGIEAAILAHALGHVVASALA